MAPISRWGHSALQRLFGPGHIRVRGFDKIHPQLFCYHCLKMNLKLLASWAPLALSVSPWAKSPQLKSKQVTEVCPPFWADVQEARGAGWLLQKSPVCRQAALRLRIPASCTILCCALGFVVRQKAREREKWGVGLWEEVMACNLAKEHWDFHQGMKAHLPWDQQLSSWLLWDQMAHPVTLGWSIVFPWFRASCCSILECGAWSWDPRARKYTQESPGHGWKAGFVATKSSMASYAPVSSAQIHIPAFHPRRHVCWQLEGPTPSRLMEADKASSSSLPSTHYSPSGHW